MIKASLVLCSLLFVATASANEFNVYKWVDEEGVPHYTDRPPMTARVEETGIRSRRTDPAEVEARAQQQREASDASANQREEAADDESLAAAERAQTLEERAANCRSARERAEQYTTARRLYRPLPNGERDYLSDAELTAARESAQNEVAQWCD